MPPGWLSPPALPYSLLVIGVTTSVSFSFCSSNSSAVAVAELESNHDCVSLMASRICRR
jgi:hypothetical protein